MSPKVYVLCGPGGVGKTTVSAALAIALAQKGLRTAVLTIDPARRLADSLQIGTLDNTPRRVPLANGTLDALMLDQKETFDRFVEQHATPEDAKKLLANRYYQFASEKMGGVQEYTAMIRLLNLYDSGSYDAIVLDTPPSRNALEFLRAPQRMAHLMERSALKFFSRPKGFRALAFGTEVLSKGLKLFMGAEMIDDVSLFFSHFGVIGQAMYKASQRADSLLHESPFYMVSSTRQSISECTIFQHQLEEEKYPFAGYILNRVPVLHPPIQAATPADREWIDWVVTNTKRQQEQFRTQKEVLTKKASFWSIPEQEQCPNQMEALQHLGQYLNVL